MSTFGSPGGRQSISKPIPPERGSFPLDHDAECQPIMKQYLRCLRSHRGVNDDECRMLSKGYLQCRMDRWVLIFSYFFSLLVRIICVAGRS